MDQAQQTTLNELGRLSPQVLNALLGVLVPSEAKELAEILEIEENQHLWELMGRRNASFEAGPLVRVTKYTTELSYGNGSRIIGVPKGENQVRLYHPYGYVSDESAFQPEFRECFNAVRPVAKQIIAVSSDEMGPFHDWCREGMQGQ